MLRRNPAPLVLAVLAVSWGAVPLIVRDVSLPSMQLVALRVWLGALTLAAILLWRRELRLPRRHAGRLLAGGLLLPLHWYAFFEAIETTRVLVALVVVYVASPLMGTVATRLLGEALHPVTALALVTGLAGAALAVDAGTGATLEGTVWALAAAVTLAAIILIMKPAAAALGGLAVAAWQEMIAAAVVVPWALAAVPNVGGDWWKVVVLGVGLTGVSLAIYWWTVARMPVALVGILMYLEPVSAVVAAAAVLDEDPGVRGWVGVAVAVISGAVATWDSERRARRRRPVPVPQGA